MGRKKPVMDTIDLWVENPEWADMTASDTGRKRLRKPTGRQFARLSWEILEHRCRYYVLDDAIIGDRQYDMLEKKYIVWARRLRKQPTALDMVGYTFHRPSCVAAFIKVIGLVGPEEIKRDPDMPSTFIKYLMCNSGSIDYLVDAYCQQHGGGGTKKQAKIIFEKHKEKFKNRFKQKRRRRNVRA